MSLDTMEPDPVWSADANADAVEAFADLADEVTVRVWGADWCGDCRSELPAFAAALDAAGVPDDAVHEFEVDREKAGELTDEYDVEYIPTIVVERDGTELARFVESESVSAPVFLADRLREVEPSA